MEVVQMNNAHLWDKPCVTTTTKKNCPCDPVLLYGTSRKAAGIKILVKRTGTENFSRPMSSNLDKHTHTAMRDIHVSRLCTGVLICVCTCVC